MSKGLMDMFSEHRDSSSSGIADQLHHSGYPMQQGGTANSSLLMGGPSAGQMSQQGVNPVTQNDAVMDFLASPAKRVSHECCPLLSSWDRGSNRASC